MKQNTSLLSGKTMKEDEFKISISSSDIDKIDKIVGHGEMIFDEPCAENPELMEKFVIGKDGLKKLVYCANTDKWEDF